MESKHPAQVAQKLVELRQEHRDLDEAISRLSQESWQDQLMLRRMKKRKLKIKDWIDHLESLLIPDLDA
jgi:hypothetical protein